MLPRPLNYVARSSLFVPLLGALIRSVGGFPIQRELGVEGLKETLRRLRAALCRLLGHGADGHADPDDIPAVPEDASRDGAGVARRSHFVTASAGS